MSDRYVVTVSYVTLAFDDKESAVRCFNAIADAIPATHVSTWGEEHVPDRLKDVTFVRDGGNFPLEIKRYPAHEFALYLTQPEFREALKPPETIDAGAAQSFEPDFAEVPTNEVVAGPVPEPINGVDNDPI